MSGAAAGKGRIAARFAALRAEGRAGLVAYVTAGDPDPDRSLAIVQGLPAAGADLIELGMPFTDPMADGPAIQAANLRALAAGASLRGTLDLVRAFRRGDDRTPVVLMGYANPIFQYGADRFAADAVTAGIDGMIVVDAPSEEDGVIGNPLRAAGLDYIRLATPTSDDARMPAILQRSSGFLYYVSIAGITGTRAPDYAAVATAVARVKRHTDLPVVVGFGIREPAQAAEVARAADGAAVGTAFVEAVRTALEGGGDPVASVLDLASRLSAAVRGARSAAGAVEGAAG